MEIHLQAAHPFVGERCQVRIGLLANLLNEGRQRISKVFVFTATKPVALHVDGVAIESRFLIKPLNFFALPLMDELWHMGIAFDIHLFLDDFPLGHGELFHGGKFCRCVKNFNPILAVIHSVFTDSLFLTYISSVEMTIRTPKEFSFELAMQFLKRSPRELLHRLDGERVLKLLEIDQRPMLVSILGGDQQLIVQFLNRNPSEVEKSNIQEYITEWFDLVTDLKPFYAMARKDDLLRNLVKRFHGYRIVGQPDLFESLIWAVLGQQINLAFAYTLKQRFVEKFGERLAWNDQDYFLFPRAAQVAGLTDEDLLPLQFSRQKSRYTVGIAEAFASGKMSKEKLRGLSLTDAKEELMKIKGIGNWTANYALMKTFRYPDAFPLEDAGVHNAIKNQLGLKAKPSLERVKKIFRKYKGWEAYATLYLWKSL